MDIPVRMRQTRMPTGPWESLWGFKCQMRSTRTPLAGAGTVVSRRGLRLVLALALAMLASPAHPLPRQSAEDFLRELYAAEAWRIAQGRALGQPDLLALFAPQIAELLRLALADPDPALREGPAPNALLGWDVPAGADIALLGVSQALGTSEAPIFVVDVMVSGARRIVIDLVESPASWRISSIIYDEGEDFLSFERRLARR